MENDRSLTGVYTRTHGITLKEPKKYLKSVITIIILLAISFLLTMKSGFNYFNTSYPTETDGNVFNCIGWLMKQGYVPYTDIFDHKGVFLYFLQYLGTSIGKYKGIYVIEVIFITASVFLTYKILRKFTNKKLAIFSILIIFARYAVCGYGNCCEEFSILFQVIALYFFLDFFEKPSKYLKSYNSANGITSKNKISDFFDFRICLLGICFACVFFMKANFCAIWIVFCIAIAFKCIREKLWKDLIRFIISFLIGIIIIAFPCMIYIIKNNAMSDFIYDYFTFNGLYNTNINRVNIRTRVNAFTTFINTIPAITAFLIMIFRVKKKDDKYYAFDIIYLIYMLVVVLLTTMSGQVYPKMEIAILPIFIYPFAQLAKMLETNKWKENQISTIIISFFAIMLVVPSWVNLTNNTANYISRRVDFGDEKIEHEVAKYIREHTTKDDTITVVGNECFIYMNSNRLPGTKYIFFPLYQIDNRITENYFEELEKNLPTVIVISTKFTEEDKPISDRINKFLEENDYELVLKGNKPVYKLEK